ncbi:MAG: protein tyrosine phosphatase [Desulfobulbaceae bacterium]|nr:protein tyrosine phosphatase [Desulfobulbaceae bacterium]
MYELHWITSHLATGHAPMSYAHLDDIRAQGISAIINLCDEFCDLHEIEETSGFDVFYLPIPDECAPDKATMEQGLDWLDEAIYLNKKVLVHCRMGHGRTGTFIAAYLMRRGFDFKGAQKAMKGRNANPATFAQRRFLKKYGKEEGVLKVSAPRIDSRRGDSTDTAVIAEFSQVLEHYDQLVLGRPLGAETMPEFSCCSQPFYLYLVESMHLSQELNRLLRLQKRQEVINRALALSATMKTLGMQPPTQATSTSPVVDPAATGDVATVELVCPLWENGYCLAAEMRPLRCRYWGKELSDALQYALIEDAIVLSRKVFIMLTGKAQLSDGLRFSLADTVTGKYVQLSFQTLTAKRRADNAKAAGTEEQGEE